MPMYIWSYMSTFLKLKLKLSPVYATIKLNQNLRASLCAYQIFISVSSECFQLFMTFHVAEESCRWVRDVSVDMVVF